MSGCFDNKGIDAELERKTDAQIEPESYIPGPGRCIMTRIKGSDSINFDITKIKERDGE